MRTDRVGLHVLWVLAGLVAAANERGAVVYDWDDAKELTPEANRLKQLELENLQLKQLVGTLSLEKKLLLDRLGALERG